jgi:hypothetical protein
MASRRARVASRLIGGLALAAAGCDGGSVPFSQFEASAEQAVCHALVLCGKFPDEATCLASEQVQPHYYETLGSDISAGKVIYDGGRAKACLDAVDGLGSCNGTTVSPLQSPLPQIDPTCNAIFRGTVAAGGACFFSEECANGGTCTSTQGCTADQCCAGACVTYTNVAEGGDCNVPDAVCPSGTTCAADSTTDGYTCQRLPGAGAPCIYPHLNVGVCAKPLYCDDPTMGTCKAFVATGGPCDPSVGNCEYLDRCDPTTLVCTPLLPVGSACGVSPIGCVSYATCDTTTSTCVELTLVGAACDPNGLACLGGTCDRTTSTCMLTPTGDACQ